nr:uncharacterized protein LOC111423679 [Onthophagus taurus]
MKFRKRPNSSECIDYIMFKGKKYGKVSKKFCGSFDVESAMERFVVKKASLIAMASKNVYQSDLDDDVMVIIHMNVNHNETKSNYYDLGAELVLTSYTNCRSNPPWFYKPCISKNLDTICIEDVYFTDGYVNCPFKGCVDEGTCVPLMVKIYGKRIFIGTIIGVIISVCLSVCCFFYCTPYKERSVEQQNDLPPNYMLPRIDDDEETDFSSDEEGMRRFDEEIGKESEEERENWDKPPLYESLFPEGPSSSFSKP